jgi:hypothetical protein
MAMDAVPRFFAPSHFRARHELRRQGAAATALWKERAMSGVVKAVSRFACHRSPKHLA